MYIVVLQGKNIWGHKRKAITFPSMLADFPQPRHNDVTNGISLTAVCTVQ